MDSQRDATTPATRHKTGNACLGCRRRKLKCSRDAPCSNCAKADLPCIYDELEPGLKRKRGPYKKDKSTREQHLEYVNRYLQTRSTKVHDNNNNNSNTTLSSPEPNRDASGTEPNVASLLGEPGNEGAHADDLLRNAVDAITSTSPAGESRRRSQTDQQSTEEALGGYISEGLNYCFYVYQQRVDPVTKFLHWPSFMQDFYDSGGFKSISGQREVLIRAICFAAINASSDDEVYRNLSAPKDRHLSSLSYSIEATLVDSTEIPKLEVMQALLLYMTTLRRGNDDTGRWMFPLAVRMAQLIGLHRDPDNTVLPLEAEIRRRLWWTLCNLESRSAEEGSMRSRSIMDDSTVSLPLNLNDSDLSPQLARMPNEREGYSDVLLPKCRWQVTFSTYKIWQLRPNRLLHTGEEKDKSIKVQQQRILDDVKTFLQDKFLRYLDRTRRMDWLTLASIEVMIVKAQILIDHPCGLLKTCMANPENRMVYLRRAVFIIERTTALQINPCNAPFHWFFRNSIQWHALAVVITDLSKSNDEAFCRTAWAALSPFLVVWEKLWESRKHEPAWQHVNALLVEAKLRRQSQSGERSSKVRSFNESTPHPTQTPILQNQTLQTGHSNSFKYGFSGDQLLYDTVSPISFDAALSNVSTDTRADSGYSDASLAALQTPEGDPFETFDPRAFEQVFGSIDWDNIDPLLSEQSI